MHDISEPRHDHGLESYRCPDCDTDIESVDATLMELRLVRTGSPSLRVVTAAGVEVHRCRSPFLVLSF